MTLIGTDLSPRYKGPIQMESLLGIPTETVYGLAANAMDPDAVARIFSV